MRHTLACTLALLLAAAAANLFPALGEDGVDISGGHQVMTLALPCCAWAANKAGAAT